MTPCNHKRIIFIGFLKISTDAKEKKMTVKGIDG